MLSGKEEPSADITIDQVIMAAHMFEDLDTPTSHTAASVHAISNERNLEATDEVVHETTHVGTKSKDANKLE